MNTFLSLRNMYRGKNKPQKIYFYLSNYKGDSQGLTQKQKETESVYKDNIQIIDSFCRFRSTHTARIYIPPKN